MFKSALWRSEKNKVKAVFKLQFHATQLKQVGADALMISVVPADVGKPTVKSDKAAVRDGSCFWENPLYETVKFTREPKSGKYHERIYQFVVGMGLSKAGIVGEASIDFSNYAEAYKVTSVSLPLKNPKTEAVLHVSIQRMLESIDQSEVDENEKSKLDSKDNSLRSQFGNDDADEAIKRDSVEDVQFNKTVPNIIKLNRSRRASSGSDVTMSSSEGAVGHDRSQWEASTDDSSSTPRENSIRHHSEEASDIVIEKLKTDLAALSRQAEMSELELQALRKQIVKESKRAQDLFREVVCLKEERDALKGECEKLKAFQGRTLEGKTKTNLHYEGGDAHAIIGELRQELMHANELNANLQVQIQKTQESNSELMLAVRDLDEMSEQKNRDISSISDRSLAKERDENTRDAGSRHQDDNDDDEEQKALEELVKEHSDAKEAYLLEQEVMDLRSEIEIYKRDKDELEMQMEQLALDYEIMKQENHDMSHKLELSQLQEQLKMQYECPSTYTSARELEIQIENLENELIKRSKLPEDSMATIRELEDHIKSLEEDLEKQAQGFEADLEALTHSKTEQEQRAIRAEETLRKTRWQNASTAERLQEELRRLSVQMASTFEANEKRAAKALAEANELRLQKSHLEENLRKASEENQSVKGHYETRLNQLSNQVRSMTDQIELLQSELEDSAVRMELQKKNAEETQRLLSDEILMLKDEVEKYNAKNKILSEDMGKKEYLMHELGQTRISVREMELFVEEGNDERTELQRRVMMLTSEVELSQNEINKLRCFVEEKESIVGNMQSELNPLHAQCMDLNCSMLVVEKEKEKLRKQVVKLKSDLNKKEELLYSMEKKMKDGSGRGTTHDVVKETLKAGKPLPRGPKEVANLKDSIKSLEGQIELKETALETSTNAFLDKEKELQKKIEELESRLDVLNQSSVHYCENRRENKVAAIVEKHSSLPEEARITNENPSSTAKISNVQSNDMCTDSAEDLDEFRKEVALLKERNKTMEEELKEMQGRYSEISLKFAEVEGERQQLVMRVRNLVNSKKSS